MASNIKQNLRILIEEWQKRPPPLIKPRELKIDKWFRDEGINKIVSVVGFRRCGKTFLLLDFAQRKGKDNCLYLNLEDERLPKTTEVLTELTNVIKEYYGAKKIFLLLDEIQEIPLWSRWARRVNETGLYNLVLSGSSSKLSSAEIPTELRGRTVTETVFPLSYFEFRDWRGLDGPLLLREYLAYGGFPEIVLADVGKKALLLDEYFQTFLTRDIFERYKIRQQQAMGDLIRLLIASPYYTFGKLGTTLKTAGYEIGKGTVAKYLSYLTSSFFLRPLEIHTAKVKSRIQHPKKSYFTDTFFLSRAGNFSENFGRLMEEAVAGYYFRQRLSDPNFDFYYCKDVAGREVDFVLRKSQRVEKLVQVSCIHSAMEINERELVALERASDELGCHNLSLITWDYDGVIKRKNKEIRCLPLIGFFDSVRNDVFS